MKRIVYVLAFIGAIFTGCNPIEDINNDLADQPNPVVGEVEYILTDDDYDELELDFGSFNSDEDARVAIPGLLSDRYPYFGNGSSALVGYNLYIGNAFDIRNYNLDQDDYTFSGSDGLGFNSTDNPEDYLADILADNVNNPSAGDYRLAKYFQFTGDFIIVTPTVSLDENFEYGDTTGAITAVSGGEWEAHSGAGNGPVGYETTSLSMTDYPSSEIGGSLTVDGAGSEDVTNWFPGISSGMVYASTLVNLSTVSDGTYTFHLRDDDFTVGYVARVGAMDDGTGKISFGIGASSSSLEYGSTAFELNTTYLLVSSYNIDTGVANLYVLSTAEATEPLAPESTSVGDSGAIVSGISIRQGGGGPTGIFDGIRVANTWSAIMSNETLDDESVGDRTAGEMFYEYTGEAWETPSDRFYSITDEDFASMNIPSFGSSTQADDYLPTFLDLTYPFAQEGDTMDIGYTYDSSSSGLGTRGNLYTVIDGIWTAYESTIATSLQFGFENGVWVPDNTIRYTLTGADYDTAAAALLNEPGFEAAAGNLDNFGNFNRTGGSTTWSDEMMITAMGIILDSIDPGAAEEQKYIMTADVYIGSNATEDFSLIKMGGEWVAN